MATKTEANKKIFKIALEIAKGLKAEGHIKEVLPVRDSLFGIIRPYLEASVDSGDVDVNPSVRKFMDKPMTPDEEYKALRAILHSDLARGTINPQMLDKLDRIIGVNSGEDDVINVVDFSEAFPSLQKAIDVSMEILARGAKECNSQS